MSDTNTAPRRVQKRKAVSRMRSHLDIDLGQILTKDEEIVLTGQIHWGVYWKPCALLLFAFLVGVFLFVQLGIILGIAGVLFLSYAVIRRHMLMLILTNKRILVRYGILQVDVVDIRFKNVESVELERMLPAFLMGYSSVIVMGTGNRFIYIPYVGNGVAFRRAFNEMVLDDEAASDEAADRARHVQEDMEDGKGDKAL